MIAVEWYRNFVAVYRAGSVSAAARERALSQPAVSQALASLEKAVGVPLFERTSRGMKPTARGEALYASVFDAVDRLDGVTRSLLPRGELRPTLRLGASPEYFHEFALPRLASRGLALAVSLGSERDLLASVETGALDAAITLARPGRGLTYRPLAENPYGLFASVAFDPIPAEVSTAETARRLNALPWVSYSEERPTTRRAFQQTLGARFEAKTRLVVPDLRSVVRAIELGVGVGVVPLFAAERSLREGRLRELFPLDLAPDRWLLAYRSIDDDREDLLALAAALRESAS